MVWWGEYGVFWRDAPIQSIDDGLWANIAHVGPLLNGLTNPIDFHPTVSSTVVSLFLVRCPAAIIRAISFAPIDSIDAGAFKGRWTHIGEETLKTCFSALAVSPSITYGHTFCPIAWVVWIARTVTSSLYIHEADVDGRPFAVTSTRVAMDDCHDDPLRHVIRQSYHMSLDPVASLFAEDQVGDVHLFLQGIDDLLVYGIR